VSVLASSVANNVIMRTRAASAIGVRRHNEIDVIMIIAGLWIYGDWRHVATGCSALVNYNRVGESSQLKEAGFITCLSAGQQIVLEEFSVG